MASKSKSRRRVLRASCLLAALIVAGSSFAWFTSSDEVTNKLSATADYGVAIAEDFTPPEKWLPGQQIEKNVGIVNTGNIDAFVRTWLEGEMNLLAEKRDKNTWDKDNGKFTDKDGGDAFINASSVYARDTSNPYDATKDTITSLTRTKEQDLLDLGMTYSYQDTSSNDNKTVYLKELDTTIYQNPNDPTADKDNPDFFNEVMTVQAGGTLAYIKTGATNTATGNKLFIYSPNNSNTFKSSKGLTYEVDGSKKYTVQLDDTSGANTSIFNDTNNNASDDIYVNGTTIYVKDEASAVKYLGEHIDSDNFYPAASGLFIFKRNEDKVAPVTDPAVSDYEFTGYYYVKSGNETGREELTAAEESAGTPATAAIKTFEKQGKYFALQYDKDNSQRSDYVLEEDTYTVTLDDTGKVVFYPYVEQTGTYDTSKTAHKIGDVWYGEDGKVVATANVTAGAATTAKSVTLFTAQRNVIENSNLVWTYYPNTAIDNGQAYYKSGDDWYPVGSTTALHATNDATKIANLNAKDAQPMYLVQDKADSGLKIDIQLADTILGAGKTYTGKTTVANTAGSTATDNAETWTRVNDATNKKDTFYYNNDVEEGATTARLVDSVLLDGSVTQYDFLAFDFDLNVFMDSLQVTPDSAGVETTGNVRSWAAVKKNDNGEWNNSTEPVAATGARNGDTTPTTTEIEYLNWTYSAT